MSLARCGVLVLLTFIRKTPKQLHASTILAAKKMARNIICSIMVFFSSLPCPYPLGIVLRNHFRGLMNENYNLSLSKQFICILFLRNVLNSFDLFFYCKNFMEYDDPQSHLCAAEKNRKACKCMCPDCLRDSRNIHKKGND